MKKITFFGACLCVALAFTSCKSSSSAYKKAYEKAKQQEMAQSQTQQPQQAAPTYVAPAQPVAPAQTAPAQGDYRTENSQLVAGNPLKAYSVVISSFGVKANAENLKSKMDANGYDTRIVFNGERNMYRVIVASCDSYSEANSAKQQFKSRYSSNPEFQKAWLLYVK